jgi:hypothetical protein
MFDYNLYSLQQQEIQRYNIYRIDVEADKNYARATASSGEPYLDGLLSPEHP